MKYYKRINRYTLFQVTFVYVPTVCASAYNLFYTWPGRQIFWIDLECIAVSTLMVTLHIIIILRTQSEYILNLDGDAIRSPEKRRREYLVDPLSKELADDINASGY